MAVAELRDFIDAGRGLVLDTRLDRSAFMAAHIPGSLYAPINRSFSMAVDSMIEDETQPIMLIIDEARVEEVVRDLVRIGYDHIVGFATAQTLANYFDSGGPQHTIGRITFADLLQMQDQPDTAIVDVRFRSEYEAGHIPGALHASYTRLPTYMQEQDRIPRDKTLLVHCATGARSSVAASYLAREGLTVKLIDDTFSAYAQTGRLEKPQASQVR